MCIYIYIYIYIHMRVLDSLFACFLNVDGCPPSWYTSTEVTPCYKVSDTEVNWWLAFDDCEGLNSTLAIVTSESQNMAISRILAANMRYPHVYISYHPKTLRLSYWLYRYLKHSKRVESFITRPSSLFGIKYIFSHLDFIKFLCHQTIPE